MLSLPCALFDVGEKGNFIGSTCSLRLCSIPSHGISWLLQMPNDRSFEGAKAIAIMPKEKLRRATMIKYHTGTVFARWTRIWLTISPYGPTIFLIGLTSSLFAVSTPRRIPGSPSMLSEFLKAQ